MELLKNNKYNYKSPYEEIRDILGFDIEYSFLTYKKSELFRFFMI